MQSLAGGTSKVHFSHLSEASRHTLQSVFSAPEDYSATSKAKVEVHSLGILDLLNVLGVPLEKVCLLDPKAPHELTPDDGDGRFDCFLFGVGLIHPRRTSLS